MDRADAYRVDAGSLEWLVDLAEDAGMPKREFTTEGQVFVGLDWSDIAAWVDGAQQQDVSPAWRRDIMLLSEVYASEAMNAEDFASEVPWQPE